MGISRRAAIAAVSLLSAVCLAACGGSASNGSTGAATGAASAGTSGGAQKATGKVTVLAAASLQKAFEEIEKTVEKDNPGLDVTFDFQGSQDLVASLAGGDSADVLATANNSTMKTAADQKLVGSQTEFATNVLTLIVPKGNPKRITGLHLVHQRAGRINRVQLALSRSGHHGRGHPVRREHGHGPLGHLIHLIHEK